MKSKRSKSQGKPKALKKSYFKISEKERELGYENPLNPLMHRLKKK